MLVSKRRRNVNFQVHTAARQKTGRTRVYLSEIKSIAARLCEGGATMQRLRLTAVQRYRFLPWLLGEGTFAERQNASGLVFSQTLTRWIYGHPILLKKTNNRLIFTVWHCSRKQFHVQFKVHLRTFMANFNLTEISQNGFSLLTPKVDVLF